MNLRSLIYLIALSFAGSSTLAQHRHQFKFDFGGSIAAKSFIPVTAKTFYTEQNGYGFTNQSKLREVVRSRKKNIASDYITSDQPFYFSVKLPEGNYDVKITLGDKKGTSATTVRAECRRLFVQNLLTRKGEITTASFTVHVKDSIIRNGSGKPGDKVRLKEREINYRHWDNMLTLEFNDTAAKVCAVEITPNTSAINIFLAGNSTVVDQGIEPWASWGQIVPAFFKPHLVSIANYAESGEALNSFRSSRRLQKILSLMKAGDYLFIEFGHNDQKQKGEGIGPFTSYKKDLKFYISEVRKKGGIPVLVTSMHRRSFDANGKINNTLLEYPEAVRQTAAEENVAMVDLNAMSKTMYEAWGPEASIKAFVHYPANTFPGQAKKLEDNTHFNTFGAYQIARCILQSIRDQQLPLAGYLKSGLPVFNPAKPDSAENWYWPLSPLTTPEKPDGN